MEDDRRRWCEVVMSEALELATLTVVRVVAGEGVSCPGMSEDKLRFLSFLRSPLPVLVF